MGTALSFAIGDPMHYAGRVWTVRNLEPDRDAGDRSDRLHYRGDQRASAFLRGFHRWSGHLISSAHLHDGRGSRVGCTSYDFMPSDSISWNLTLGAVVPGGPGSQYAQEKPQIVDYIKRTYPKLQYIVSICTGAQILAKAGILDGKRATTTKFGWKQVVGSGPNVKWVSELEQGPEVAFIDSSLCRCPKRGGSWMETSGVAPESHVGSHLHVLDNG
jgi:hypothetical protein